MGAGEEQAGAWVLGATMFLAGLVLVWIGLKQRAGTLQRNWIAGLRTWATMRSDAAWQAAHRATAGLVVAAGVVQLVGTLGIVLMHPTEGALGAVALAAAGVTLALVLVAGVRGHRIAVQINQEDST